MSSVMDDILKLAQLTGVEPVSITHYITGGVGSVDIEIDVPIGRCIVITEVAQSGVDPANPATGQASQSNAPQTSAPQAMAIAFTGSVLYAFHSGLVGLSLIMSSAPGDTARTRVVYYELPEEALEILQMCGTRQT